MGLVGNDRKIITTASQYDHADQDPRIENDAITAAKIAAGAVGSSEIATGAVGTDELAANAVATVDIQDSAVTGATGRHGFRTAIPCKHS